MLRNMLSPFVSDDLLGAILPIPGILQIAKKLLLG